METIDIDLQSDEALILEGSDRSFSCVVFNIPSELLARIALIADCDAFNCEKHQSLVLNHLLELGTTAKEAELATHADQEEMF